MNMDEIFKRDNKMQNEKLHQREATIAPTSFGKTFMVHYAIQVSLKHPGIFCPATTVEVEINIEASNNDIRRLEKQIIRSVERSQKFLDGP